MKIIGSIFLLLYLLIIFMGLGIFYVYLNRPNNEIVNKEFMAKNPTFEVISLFVGEGNPDFAEYHINYKKA